MESAISKLCKTVFEKIDTAVSASTKTKTCRLVGASKTKSVEVMMEAYNAGVRHFGENYTDEIVKKAPLMPKDVQWHFIGHLQSNKLKQILVPNLYMLETVDSERLASKVQNACEKQARTLKVLIQIKTSDEDSKSGVNSNEEAFQLIDFILTKCPNLQFSGLMTLGYVGDLTAFDKLYDIKVLVCEKFKLKPEEVELSMGMSADFEKAILSGATNVRVGTTIFGPREDSLTWKTEPNYDGISKS